MFLGIDFGTSGCRASVINHQREQLAEVHQALPTPQRHQGRIEQDPAVWLEGLDGLLTQLSEHIDTRAIQRLAIDGTSGTILLTDNEGRPLTPALMYNDQSSTDAAESIQLQAPDSQNLVGSASSALARAMELYPGVKKNKQVYIVHQADYLTAYLSGRWGISDYHNALKLGYDIKKLCWPDWVIQLLPDARFPQILEPGTSIRQIRSELTQRYNLSPELTICAGTTDANAAFLATGLSQPGDAMTSLGSTMVLKILSHEPVQALEYGVYSHRLGNFWLAGGASNAGGAILTQFFNDQQLVALSKQIRLTEYTGLGFYPLSSRGERFPINDPTLEPRLSPRPESDVVFLQAILEGLSRIEAAGYRKLQELGAPKPGHIVTTGGGANNPEWRQMRQQLIGVPISGSDHSEACYGSALLALDGLKHYQREAIASTLYTVT
jgi:sugar (pentulose or hexulose) kinase